MFFAAQSYILQLASIHDVLTGLCRRQSVRSREAFRVLAGSLDTAQKRVLACSLAHIRAVGICVEEGYDAILEDNVRVHKNAPALLADLVAAGADAELTGSTDEGGGSGLPGWWLRYFGYLGREEDMTAARERQEPQLQTPRWAEWPLFTEPRSGRSADLFWGAYAYSLTAPAAQGFLVVLRIPSTPHAENRSLLRIFPYRHLVNV